MLEPHAAGVAATWLDSGPALFLELTIKASALMLLAVAGHALLHRASAASRHALWAATTAALLVLPLSLAAVPRVRVVPVPASLSSLAPTARGVADSPAQPRAATPEARSVVQPAEPAPEKERSTAGADPRVGRRPMAPMTLSSAGQALWLFGAMGVVAFFLLGHLRLRRTIRRARAVVDPESLVTAQQASVALDLRLPYALLEVRPGFMPMTYGLLRPRVLLPSDFSSWSAERRRAVLLHELAHVRRGDSLTQAIAQLACALFWFHPLAWLAASRLRVERERACDDLVLLARTRPSEYADHLLDIARTRSVSGAPAFGAVAFARAGHLEGRVLAVLDDKLDRRPVSRGGTLRLGVISTALTVGLACLGVSAPVTAHMDRGPLPPDPGASELVRAPEGTTLRAGLEWVQREAARRGKDYWVGYRIPPHPGIEGGVMGDSRGFDLRYLDEAYVGPTLGDVLEHRAPRRWGDRGHEERDAVGVVFHFAARRAPEARNVDALFYQSLHLPTRLEGRPLFWLNDVPESESIEWLAQVGARDKGRDNGGDKGSELARVSLEAISCHASSELVLPVLERALDGNGDEELRATAAEGMSRFPSRLTLERLEATARRDRSEQVRRAAVEAMGRLGTEEALAKLVQFARSGAREGAERRAALEALTDKAVGDWTEAQPAPEAGSGAPDEAPQPVPPARGKYEVSPEKVGFRDPSNQEDVEVQVQAVEALSRYPEAKALPKLKEIIERHPNDQVRIQAVESVGRLGTPAAFALLEDIAWHHPSQEVRMQAVECLARQEDQERALAVESKILRDHHDPETRRSAVEALGRIDRPEVVGLLVRTTRSDANPEVERQAVESLGRRDEKGVNEKLMEIARTHPNPEVRRQAVESLSRRDQDAALPFLEELLNGRGSRR